MEILLAALIGLPVGWAINWCADRLIAASELPDRQHRWRAPLVLLATAILFAALAWRFGATLQLALTALYTAVFLFVLITDLEHRSIFTVVLFPAIVFAALASPFSQLGWKYSLLGGGIALTLTLGMYFFAQAYARARGLNIAGGAFGRGDVWLAVFMGIVVGFPAIFPAILYTILLGGVGAFGSLVYHRLTERRLTLTAVMPYGPFFCIAGWWLMVFP